MAPAGPSVLQFFDAPAVRTPQAARHHIDSPASSDQAALGARFSQLVDALQQVYPDLRHSPDPYHREANMWPQGLPVPPEKGHALSLPFNPKFAERGVFAVAASCAMRCGLQMLDARNEVLYLQDGSLVRADGSTARCRGVTRFAADLMRHPTPDNEEPELPALWTLMGAGVQAMLAFQGFRRVNSGAHVLFTRQHGEVRQTIALKIERTSGTWVVSTVMWLQIPALVQEWLPALGPRAAAWYEHHRQNHAGLAPDIMLDLYNLHPQAPWAFSVFKFSRPILHQRDAPPYLGGWCDWLVHTGAADLDRINDLSSLSDSVLSSDCISRLGVGRYSPAHQASVLVLAHRVAPGKFDRVCAELRRNTKNESEGWPELDDPRLHHLERLIMALRKPFG